ncbi:MAG: chromosomal replication initiator protein DnaA [Lachnospiraceae bacterium]|jgi:chromosomal replication initiator protein|nr:chromosomal replication initiator protein DnaA [Lachnospiraceae bacterium]MDD7327428.1 chromosomal replication initiator protein DnaA [Lachnospiraceae bacterium]MDY2758552.1 chromosomal replication initiator protein DnaA [Lachnospiraceae bacterium]
MENIQSIWDEILLAVKDDYEIADVSFNTWLAPLKIVSVDGNDLTVMASDETDEMAINYISKKYEKPLVTKIADMTGKEYNIHFILANEGPQVENHIDENLLSNPNYVNSNLNEKYTFDTFVVGNNNRFAQNAALAVAETPGKNYNPLYIYGGPGLGKTHLMHAIGNYILQHNPDKKVLYVTSEEFLNEVIESIRSTNNTSSMSKFRDKYRKVDVLMIDDIQFIIGKESTQEEFFHTFNTLHSAGKQIVLTSDRPPKEMKTLEARIRSRFEWGLMADIGNPDYETRMAILRKKVEDENISLDDEILNYIATNITTNVREIEGALNKLIAYSNIEHTDITMDIAQQELANIIAPEKPREITPQLIIEVVADHYDITIDQMTSKNRSKNIAEPRQIAMYLCKQLTDYPLDAIGQLLGGRDHSTIIYGANKVADDYKNNAELKKQIDTIKKKIDPKS